MDDRTLAIALVTGAAGLAARMRDGALGAESKSHAADLVTAADRAAEAFVRSTLRIERPGDGVIGEEGTRSEPASSRRWVVDPIDGTFNYVSGLAAWCSAVALEEDGRLVLGAVRRLLPDETWVAIDGHSWLNGDPVAALGDRRLAECSVATHLDAPDLSDATMATGLLDVVAAAATIRVSGSGTCDLADVAAGRLGLWLQVDCADWDWLPGRALVEGVGGRSATLEARGRRWHLAGAPSAVEEAVEILR